MIDLPIDYPIAMSLKRRKTIVRNSNLDAKLVTKYFILVLVFFYTIIADCSTTIEKTANIVEGIVGGTAKLHCIVSRHSQGDNPILVLWYKDGARMPFFTLDLREDGPEQFFDDKMGSRVNSDVSGEFLTIRALIVSDSANYKCKVNYNNSPSLEAKSRLIVYEPPKQILIRDELDNVLTGPVLGPIHQDSRLRLYCEADGGIPPPTVSWWSGSTLLTNSSVNLEHSLSSSEEDRRIPPEERSFLSNYFNKGMLITTERDKRSVVSELNIIKIGRKHARANITCLAQNNNISDPLQTSLTLSVYMRPESVEIHLPKEPLRENIPAKLKCEAIGSYPTAKLSWEKTQKDKPIVYDPKQTNLKDNISVSWLTILPKAEDHTELLTCKAHTPALPGKATSGSIVLDIHYVPRVSLKLGKNLAHRSIKEGEDVYFECDISSNPRQSQIVWHRNESPVEQNLKAGILLSQENLVLQRIHRNSAGNYTCSARNDLGTTKSNNVELKVMFLPVCDTEPVTVAVAEEEGVKLLCQVAARPSRNLQFIWLFNNTLDTVEVETTRVVVDGPLSYIDYTPVSSRDYGTLSCWATNEVGMQAEPCSFTVIEAGPPGRVKNCVLFNHTMDSLEVQCSPGNDGGSAQRFLAKVYVASTHTLIAELRSKKPKFHVKGLTQGQDYLVSVIAINNKGFSKAEDIDAIRLKVAEKRMVDIKSPVVSPLVVVFLGLVGGFVSLFIIGLLLSRAKISRLNCFWRKHNGNRRNEAQDESVELNQGSSFKVSSKSRVISSFSISKGVHEGKVDSPDLVKGVSNESSFLLNLTNNKCPEVITRRHSNVSPADNFHGEIDELKCHKTNENSHFLEARSPILLPSDESFV